jgi:hypothetical protein
MRAASAPSSASASSISRRSSSHASTASRGIRSLSHKLSRLLAARPRSASEGFSRKRARAAPARRDTSPDETSLPRRFGERFGDVSSSSSPLRRLRSASADASPPSTEVASRRSPRVSAASASASRSFRSNDETRSGRKSTRIATPTDPTVAPPRVRSARAPSTGRPRSSRETSTLATAATLPVRPSANSSASIAASRQYRAKPAGLATTGNTNVASASRAESKPTQGRAASATRSSPHQRAETRTYGGGARMNHSRSRRTSSTWPVSPPGRDVDVSSSEGAFGGRLAPVANLEPC